MDQRVRSKRPGKSTGTPGQRARTRILDTAEELFARQGPTAVTLRSIAAAAEVNVAAVNYYFGSKEKLFEEMFLRRVVPLNDQRLTQLDACIARAGGNPTLEAIVSAFVMPAWQLADTASTNARAIFVQYSAGRVLAMPEVDEMLSRYYARLREAFVAALQRALPHLAQPDVIWRYYWMGGSLMMTLAVPSETVGAADDPVEETGSGVHAMLPATLIAFLVQGMHAAPVLAQQPEVLASRVSCS
jgi:AcrR family transcriptional regulator